MTPFYTLLRGADLGLVCGRCGRTLSQAVRFTQDGQVLTVGRECATHYGITWTAQYGPAWNDPEVLQAAFSYANTHWERAQHRYAWDYSYAERRAVNDLVGNVAWQMILVFLAEGRQAVLRTGHDERWPELYALVCQASDAWVKTGPDWKPPQIVTAGEE